MRTIVRPGMTRAWQIMLCLVLPFGLVSAAVLCSGRSGLATSQTATAHFPCGCDDVDLGLDTGDDSESAAAKPPPPGFVSIVVDTDKLTLTVYIDEEVWHKFTVATGTSDTPTALGEWRIVDKGVWGGAFGARWMGLSIPWARYGIHGTNRPGSIGSRASHGCVRMLNRDVKILYPRVRIGTPVKIIGRPRSHFGEVPRTMSNSTIGSDVMRLQQALKELGLYRNRIDGRFGWGTEKAVRDYQWATFRKVTGVADKATREALGLP